MAPREEGVADGEAKKTEKQRIPEGTAIIRALIAETVLGFITWSLLHGFGPMIWFYPLNELEISGYEAFVVVVFTPIFTAIGAVFNAVQTKWGLALLRAVMVGCVASFQAPSTLSRLVVLAMGNAANVLVLVGTLWNKSSFQRTMSFWGLMLGFIDLLGGRIWYTSLSPAWADHTTNSVVVAVGAVAIVDRVLADDYEAPVKKETPQPVSRPSWVVVSMGFGSLMFLTQMIYGEVSLVSRWVVTGYPDPGPAPNPWGSLVLLGLANGLLLSSSDWLTGNPLWFLVGGVGGAAAIQFLPTYQGFLGGILLAVYVMSIWPKMCDQLVLCPPARTMVLTFIVYLVEIFGMVWCTAYNFVPLGEYTRERTYILLAITVLCIGAAVHLTSTEGSSLAFVDIDTSGPYILFKKFVGPFLSIIVIGGLGGFVFRYNPEPYNHPPKSDPKEFTSLIWTFHFGYDNRGWPSFERAAKMLNETGADVITLLESDASKPYLGNNDLAMWLGEKLDMYTDFGVSTRDHTWGNLLLSKYPIVKSRHHMLPSPHGELAPAISATINISGSLVDFVTTHMGNDRDDLDRRLQAEYLSEIAKNSGNPVVFLGYVTSSPGSRDYRKLLNNGGMKDIDSTDRDRWCEYIMYKKLIRLGYARISHGGLSDTEVQMAKFRIPQDPKNYKDNSRLTTDPKQVDQQLHFTDRFGSFFRGHSYSKDHHYHMDTPKYFLP